MTQQGCFSCPWWKNKFMTHIFVVLLSYFSFMQRKFWPIFVLKLSLVISGNHRLSTDKIIFLKKINKNILWESIGFMEFAINSIVYVTIICKCVLYILYINKFIVSTHVCVCVCVESTVRHSPQTHWGLRKRQIGLKVNPQKQRKWSLKWPNFHI